MGDALRFQLGGSDRAKRPQIIEAHIDQTTLDIAEIEDGTYIARFVRLVFWS
jgi:hypothetical protein